MSGLASVISSEFAGVYEAEFSAVWGFLHRLGARGATLEDLAHDVFLMAYRRFETFERGRPVRPWLFGIAFRVASDFRSLARHVREVPDDEGPEPQSLETPESSSEVREAQGLVSAALEALSLEQRAVFVMHELEERPIPEVAATLGILVPTAYTRLRAARQRFGAAVERLSPGGTR